MGMNMGRIAAMAAGLPKEVAATTVNRFCSSGSQAIAMAAHQIINEGAEAAIGAGVETITMMQDGTQNTTRLVNAAARERFPGLYFPMGITAEIVAERYKISREDQDQYSLQSQQRYAKAVEEGKIAEDIAPMKVTRRVMKKGEDPYEEDFTVEHDERSTTCAVPRQDVVGRFVVARAVIVLPPLLPGRKAAVDQLVAAPQEERRDAGTRKADVIRTEEETLPHFDRMHRHAQFFGGRCAPERNTQRRLVVAQYGVVMRETPQIRAIDVEHCNNA
jgi:hypothetical protein